MRRNSLSRFRASPIFNTEPTTARTPLTPLFACFISFVADRKGSHFTTTHLSDIDVHPPVASYDHEARKKLLSAFYIAHGIPVKYTVEGTLKFATFSPLAEVLPSCASIQASIFTIFGGQGINEIYVEALDAFWHILSIRRAFPHLGRR